MFFYFETDPSKGTHKKTGGKMPVKKAGCAKKAAPKKAAPKKAAAKKPAAKKK